MAAVRRQWFCMKLSDVYFKFIPHTEGEQIIFVEGPGVPDKTLGQIEERYILRTASTLQSNSALNQRRGKKLYRQILRPEPSS